MMEEKTDTSYYLEPLIRIFLYNNDVFGFGYILGLHLFSMADMIPPAFYELNKQS